MMRNLVKLIILLCLLVLVAVSCRGPKECWGVTSDADQPAIEQNKE